MPTRFLSRVKAAFATAESDRRSNGCIRCGPRAAWLQFEGPPVAVRLISDVQADTVLRRPSLELAILPLRA